MTISLEGGCLCGAVRYRISGSVLDSGSCHCRSCRKASSAPELPFVQIATEAFELTRGYPARYHSSSHVTRSFCGHCGSPLTYRHHGKPDRLDVMSCSLDDPDAVPPTYHVWVSQKPAWAAIDDDLPAFDTTRSAAG